MKWTIVILFLLLNNINSYIFQRFECFLQKKLLTSAKSRNRQFRSQLLASSGDETSSSIIEKRRAAYLKRKSSTEVTNTVDSTVKPQMAKETTSVSVAQKLYDSIKGSNAVLTLNNFVQWSYMKDKLGRKLVTQSFLDKAVVDLGLTYTIDLNQFNTLMSIINDEVTRKQAAKEQRKQIAKSQPRLRTKKDIKRMLEASEEVIEEEFMAPEVTPNDIINDSFGRLKEQFRGNITPKSLGEWKEIKGLLKVGALTQDQVNRAIQAVGTVKEVDIEVLKKFVQIIDNSLDRSKMNEVDFHPPDRFSKK